MVKICSRPPVLLTAARVAIIRRSSFRDIKFSNDSKDE